MWLQNIKNWTGMTQDKLMIATRNQIQPTWKCLDQAMLNDTTLS